MSRVFSIGKTSFDFALVRRVGLAPIDKRRVDLVPIDNQLVDRMEFDAQLVDLREAPSRTCPSIAGGARRPIACARRPIARGAR